MALTVDGTHDDRVVPAAVAHPRVLAHVERGVGEAEEHDADAQQVGAKEVYGGACGAGPPRAIGPAEWLGPPEDDVERYHSRVEGLLDVCVRRRGHRARRVTRRLAVGRVVAFAEFIGGLGPRAAPGVRYGPIRVIHLLVLRM